MRCAIVNLGCKVNRVESDGLAAALESLGFSFAAHAGTSTEPLASEDARAAGGADAAGDPESASLVVVNTCTVTGEAEKKTRKAVRRALRDNPHAAVVVTGCAAAIDPAVFESMDARVIVAGKLELGEAVRTREGLSKLAPHLAEALRLQGGRVANEAAAADGGAMRIGEGFPTRVGIKIQDGCDNACTYCIVHVARGRAWSRPASEVEDEFRRYAEAGVREIVLSGINLGTYQDGDVDLEGLLRALLAVAGEPRIRLSSIEPKDVSDPLIELMAASGGRIARHLHLPLQSGSTRVLKRMARPYTAERFCDLVERLYEAMPGLSLSTDVIVGFPGETGEDFEATLDVARRCRFSKIHVFPYSKRAGTPAAGWPDQVDSRAKAARAAELSALADRLRAEAYRDRIGTVEMVLVETGGRGMTESYFEIAVPADAQPGSLVAIELPEEG